MPIAACMASSSSITGFISSLLASPFLILSCSSLYLATVSFRIPNITTAGWRSSLVGPKPADTSPGIGGPWSAARAFSMYASRHSG